MNKNKTHLQKSDDLKVKGLLFTSFFHVPENGRFQKKNCPRKWAKRSYMFYWLQFATT